MKKLALIIGACVGVVVILVLGAGLWVKGHMGEITRKLTGMEIRFSDLDISYSPMPTIVLTDLSLEQDSNTVKVPSLKLYPDFGRIFSGQIHVKKAVLEEPLVVAKGLGERRSGPDVSPPPGGEPFSAAAIPAHMVVVNHGRLVLETAQGAVLPVAVTGQVERVDQSLSVQLKNASIDEIGLKIAGNVSIASFAPLRFKIDAAEGTFNPSAVKDFLLKFGYLKEDVAGQIPAIQSLGSTGLQLSFDAESGKIDLAAETVSVDKNQFQGVTVNLADGGAFGVDCSKGVVDVGAVFGWLQQGAERKKALDETLTQAKLKALTPEGSIQLSAIKLQQSGQPKEGESGTVNLDGSLDVSVQGLVLRLVAENGAEQSLTISQLESKVTIKQGRPSVSVEKLTFDSSRGGTGSISGALSVPFDLKRIKLKGAIDSLKVFDTTLDLHVNKDGDPKATFDIALAAPSFKVFADGLVYIPGRKQTDLEARLTNLRIASLESAAQTPAKKKETSPKASPKASPRTSNSEPFDFSMIKDKKVSAKAFIKTFQFGDLTRLEDVDLHLQSADDRAVLNGTVRMCGIDLILGAVVFPPSQLVTTLETKGTDVDLTSLVACFSKELPVFLAGRLYVSGSFATKGDSPKALIDHVEGDVTVTITRASVYRLSGLDSRLGFLLDMIQAARISPDQKDSISFSRGVLSANLNNDRVVFDNFSLVGPLLSASGKGEFTMKDKRLKLSGAVNSLGVTKALNIDRVLEKRET